MRTRKKEIKRKRGRGREKECERERKRERKRKVAKEIKKEKREKERCITFADPPVGASGDALESLVFSRFCGSNSCTQ